MIIERTVYALLAILFLVWTGVSIRSGESRLIYSTVKRSEDALMFWVGVAITVLIAASMAWLVVEPMPFGWPYKR